MTSSIHGTGNIDRTPRPAPAYTPPRDITRAPESRARAIEYRTARGFKYGSN